MPHARQARIKAAYVFCAAYFGQTLSDHVLVMYAEDLDDLPCEAVLSALKTLRREPGRRFCPLPGDVRRLVAPSAASDAALADEIAGKIGSAINKIGYTFPDKAQAYIGPLGWKVVVELLGGWRHVCNTQSADSMRTFHAQVRDMCKSQLELERVRAHLRQTPPALAPPASQAALPKSTEELRSVGEILAHSLGSSFFAR